MQKPKLNPWIFLNESPIDSPYEIIHRFIENFVFFKWIFFKNRPRTTFLLIRSFMITGVVFGLYYILFSNIKFLIMGIDIDPILIFVSGAVLGYWNMSRSFEQKSQYCSNLYNEYLKLKGLKQDEAAELVAVNFCTQLVTLDLWSHRMYSWLFTRTLHKAAEYSYNSNGECFRPKDSSLEDFIRRANQRKLTISEVRLLFLCYQDSLLD